MSEETAAIEPGSRPLTNPKHEAFARARSLGATKLEAARAAGYATMTPGNAAKLERLGKGVLDRIAYFCRQEEEIIALKRRKLEERLWLWHDMPYTRFFQTAEEDEVDAEGKPTGVTKKVQRLRLFDELTEDERLCIESLKFTEKGKPILETYSRMQANIELRKMNGIGPTGKAGEGDLSQLSEQELHVRLYEQLKNAGLALAQGLAEGMRVRE